MNRLGSHWRWRVVLGAILIVLVGIAMRTLGQRAYRHAVSGGGGPPILLEVARYSSFSIEAWDPANGQSWVVHTYHLDDPADSVPHFYSVRGGKGVAWVENGSIHIVDVMPPHQSETWHLPESLHKHSYLVGLSPSGDCGVFVKIDQSVYNSQRTEVEMVVVDLRQGGVVSQELVGDVRAHDTSGNFDFWDCWQGNPAKTHLYRYHLDDYGTWHELKVPADATVVLSQPIVGRLTPMRNLQLLDQKTGATPARGGPWTSRLRLSTTNNRYLAEANRRLYLGNLDSLTPLELKPLSSDISSFEFQSDGRDIAGVDHWGNVFQIDLETGQRRAVGNPGTRQYWKMMAVIALLGITVGVWVYVAFSEQALGWGLIDAMVVSWIASAMAALAKIAYLPFGPGAYWLPSGKIAGWMDAPLIGIGVASLYLVAWYWAYGNRHVLLRMAGGILWVAVVVTPVVVMTRFLYCAERIPSGGFWEPMIAQSVLFSGVSALVLAAPRWFGWRLRKGTSESEETLPKLRRFGLASLFTAITVFAIVLALCRLPRFDVFENLAQTSVQEAAYVVCALSPSLAIGLPVAFTSRSRRQLVISVLAITVGTIVELYVICGLWNNHFLAHVATRGSGAAFAALLPCILLRRHGYRWYRASSIARSPEQEVAVT